MILEMGYRFAAGMCPTRLWNGGAFSTTSQRRCPRLKRPPYDHPFAPNNTCASKRPTFLRVSRLMFQPLLLPDPGQLNLLRATWRAVGDSKHPFTATCCPRTELNGNIATRAGSNVRRALVLHQKISTHSDAGDCQVTGAGVGEFHSLRCASCADGLREEGQCGG